LQTPITAILGFSSLLDEQYESLAPQERRDYIARVARNATSLSSLVRELLDYSRLGRRGFELHLHDVDLSEVAARIVDQFGALVERHQLVFDAQPGVWAVADGEAIERVLSNLLSNAAKYSPPGSLITVSLTRHGDEAVLTVDDAGAGVSAQDAPHVFRRFYRGESPAAVATRGAGIGLAVVQDLIERMGGSVSVGSAPSGGARFTIVLPVKTGAPANPPNPPSEPAGQGRMP
jgi:signal transduction histidine kinase